MKRHAMRFRAVAAAAAMTFVAAQTASACTGIMLRNADGSIVHGRTVEFGIPLAIDFAIVPRGCAFTGMTPLGEGKKWTAKYGALGAIVFGNLGIMDGVNEKGLAIGAFYFPTMAEYTPTTVDNQAKSMSSIDFSNWVLTSFASVDEVRAAVESGDVAVAPTLLPGWPPTVPLSRTRDEIRLASPCNIWAEALDDVRQFRGVHAGAQIVVRQARDA